MEPIIDSYTGSRTNKYDDMITTLRTSPTTIIKLGLANHKSAARSLARGTELRAARRQ